MAEQNDSEETRKVAIDKAVSALLPKLVESIFTASPPKTDKPNEGQEKIPIYEKLTAGEILIISRSDKGFLVVANHDGECDIRYYDEE